MADPIMTLEGVSRSFFGVPALVDVRLDIRRGRALGLVGQNGAGKSTLMNLLGGVLRPDSGAMRLEGTSYAPTGPRDASRRRIGFIHQELNLFTNLSIAENIFIDDFPRRSIGPFRAIDRKALQTRTAQLLEAVSLEHRPETSVGSLTPGERQLVEVAKALYIDADIIIFDEPTTSLTSRETTRLFALLERLKASGKTIIYISHALADVARLADDVAVLRDGRIVGTGGIAEFPVSRMINLMLGRDIDQLFPPKQARPTNDVLLDVKSLARRGVVKDISFELHVGEVVGLFGLMGSGRTELARMLFGVDDVDTGSVSIEGTSRGRVTPRASIKDGVSFITENRREEGLLMDVPISDNIGLAALGHFASPLGLMDDARLLAGASDLAAALKIKSGPIATQPVKSLSGGNQQKVVIAKWLLAGPRIFILDEPTRGIDVASKYEIYAMIDDLASRGSGILFISSEIEEVMAMSDRLLVMSRGEIVDRFVRADFDREAILRAAFREQEHAA
jgi:ribose transport system ATP-binding protein